MATRVPFIRINGASGGDIVPGLGAALLGVTITDNEGHESDECVIRMVDRPPYNRLPAKGAKFSVAAGWQGGGDTLSGVYAFETFRKSGDPEEGKAFELVCRAADFIDKMKAVESRHYDPENGFPTVGAIYEDLARRAGVPAAIDAEIAAIKVPYRLRWQQSGLDFGTDLADEIGAVMKPQAGRLVVRKAGCGRSVSGSVLPAVTIRADDRYGYEFDIDPRPEHKQVAGPWFDPATGRLKEALQATAAQFSRLALMHPFASEAEAKRAAKEMGRAMNRAAGTGSVEMAGDARAVGGAPANLSGYGAGVDGLDWEVASATHEISPADDGWITQVELQTREV